MVAFLLFVIVVALIFGRKAAGAVLLLPVAAIALFVLLLLTLNTHPSPPARRYDTFSDRFTPAQDSAAAALLAMRRPCIAPNRRAGVERPGGLTWTNEGNSAERRPFISYWGLCEDTSSGKLIRNRPHR